MNFGLFFFLYPSYTDGAERVLVAVAALGHVEAREYDHRTAAGRLTTLYISPAREGQPGTILRPILSDQSAAVGRARY